MRKIAILITIILLPFCLSTKAENLNNVLDKAAAKYKKFNSLEISFTLSMINEQENIKDSQDGKAWMKGNKYKLNIMGAENYFDGKDIFTYLAEAEELTIKKPNAQEEDLLNPTKLFNIHKKGFNLKILENINNIVLVELTPKKENNFKNIKIWIDANSLIIKKVVAYGQDNNDIEVLISHIKEVNPSLADDFFVFDTKKYPGTTVIDMR